MTELRLILGDQLNPHHSWFDTCSPNVIYVMLELRAETAYVLHHAQKIIAIFAAMRALTRDAMDAGAAGVMIAPPNTLRTDELETRFPGLLAVILRM